MLSGHEVVSKAKFNRQLKKERKIGGNRRMLIPIFNEYDGTPRDTDSAGRLVSSEGAKER